MELSGFNFNYSYYYILSSEVLKELIERDLDLEVLVCENKAIPLAPLKKYSFEKWEKHPVELFFPYFIVKISNGIIQ